MPEDEANGRGIVATHNVADALIDVAEAAGPAIGLDPHIDNRDSECWACGMTAPFHDEPQCRFKRLEIALDRLTESLKGTE